MTTSAPNLVAIPGDGIGKEVVPVAVDVLNAAVGREGGKLVWTWKPWGSDFYKQHGQMMPEDGLDQLRAFDGILFGAVGDPDVPDDLSLWTLLMPIRRTFDQFVNLRPIRSFSGIQPHVRLPAGAVIDFLIVRENTEGEYSESGGRFFRGTSREFAIQNDVFTRIGIERITRFACEQALKRRGILTSATKSNGIIHSMPFWDEVVSETCSQFPDVELSKKLIDALAAELVMFPYRFDVIVASNLFGDIISDLAAATVGSLGIAASANLSATPGYPSLFEPVHGSAPDIAGRGIANPIAAVWSGALMLEQLGLVSASSRVMQAIEVSLKSPETRTRDLEGTANTSQVAECLLEIINTTA